MLEHQSTHLSIGNHYHHERSIVLGALLRRKKIYRRGHPLGFSKIQDNIFGDFGSLEKACIGRSFLLIPVHDVAECENIGMSRQLECWENLDVSSGGEEVGGKVSSIWAGTPRRNL